MKNYSDVIFLKWFIFFKLLRPVVAQHLIFIKDFWHTYESRSYAIITGYLHTKFVEVSRQNSFQAMESILRAP